MKYLNLATSQVVTKDEIITGGNTVYPNSVVDFEGYAKIESGVKPDHDRNVENLVPAGFNVVDGIAYQQWVVERKPQVSIDKIMNNRFRQASIEVCNKINNEAREYGYPDFAFMKAVHKNQSEVTALGNKLDVALTKISQAQVVANSNGKIPELKDLVNEALGITEQVP